MRIKSRKLGKFQVSYPLIAQMVNGTSNFQDVLKNFIIVKAEFLLAADAIEYVAYSETFDELSEGEVIPAYTLEIRYLKGASPILYEVTRQS